jgi:malate dehydrogenase (oxaloacetate-decarboxylating)(NADP+)
VAELARAEQSEVVSAAYGSGNLSFGPEYLIPKPFDPRLIMKIAPAVAKAAAESGVATRPIADFDAYVDRLQEFVFYSGNFMKPIFSASKRAQKRRLVYAEGEEERVLRAIQVVRDEDLADPILIGRPAVIERRIERYGLRLKAGVDFQVVNPESDTRFRQYWEAYYQITQRQGVTAQYAQVEMRRRHTLIGAMMIHLGEADSMICGTFGSYGLHLHYIDQVLGHKPTEKTYAAMNLLILPKRSVALVDTHVNTDPSAEQLAEITLMAADEMRRIGIEPRVALLSHGEMHGDVALDPELRKAIMPNSTLLGEANLLVMPNIDAANISYNLLKVAAGNGVAVGPVLLGCRASVTILTSSATVRRIVNMTAMTVLNANANTGAKGAP